MLKLETLKTKFGTSFLSRIPASEQDFLINKSSDVLSKAYQKAGCVPSLEQILNEITIVFRNIDYGWEEAILEGKWHRWPSEIKKQVFCSENALKNYLLARTLGIPAYYLVVEDYNNTNMAHDIVLVQDFEASLNKDSRSSQNCKLCSFKPDRLLALDWEGVFPVSIKVGENVYHNVEAVGFPGQAEIIKEDGSVLSKNGFEVLSEHDVTSRVFVARSGSSVLDAVSCGQRLYVRGSDEGAVVSYIKFNPHINLLKFLFVFEPSTGGLPLYYEQNFLSINIRRKKHLLSFQDYGVAPEYKGMNLKKVSFAGSNGRAVEKLDEFSRKTFCVQIIYDSKLEMFDDGAYFFQEKERREQVDSLAALAEEPNEQNIEQNTDDNDHGKSLAKGYVSTYEKMKKMNPGAAERYIDFSLCDINSVSYFKTQEDIDAFLARSCGISSALAQEQIFIGIMVREMSKILSVPDALASQNILCKALSEKLGIDYSSHVEAHGVLDLLAAFKNDTFENTWRSKE